MVYFNFNGVSYVLILHVQSQDFVLGLFAIEGYPDKIVSDTGPQLNSRQFGKILSKMGITHTTSSPHYPRSNGLTLNMPCVTIVLLPLMPPFLPASTRMPFTHPGLHAYFWSQPLVWGHSPTPVPHSIHGPTLDPCSYPKSLHAPIGFMLTLGFHPYPQPTPHPISPRGSGDSCLQGTHCGGDSS